ncbi:hypothetical protein KCU61_g4968, partial [Aureobasidium melanogenum]
MTLTESFIRVRTQDGMVQIAYNPGETIRDLRLRLEQYTGHPASAQQLSGNGTAVTDTMQLRDLAQGPAILTLSRIHEASSRAADQIQSGHSYRNVTGEETVQQYMGNIGTWPDGSTFGNHTYDDVKGKGEALQVLGNMASFPPGFGSRGKDNSASQP